MTVSEQIIKMQNNKKRKKPKINNKRKKKQYKQYITMKKIETCACKFACKFACLAFTTITKTKVKWNYFSIYHIENKMRKSK